SSIAPSPNLIGEASITKTVSVGSVTPFICVLLRYADYNHLGESIAAPRPWPPAGHEVRGAPPPRLPPLLRAGPAQRHGRQHRARDQLLGDLPGVPFPDAGGIRRDQPLGAVPAFLGVRGRPGRSLRLSKAHSDLAGTLRTRLARVGRAVPDRHLARLAR